MKIISLLGSPHGLKGNTARLLRHAPSYFSASYPFETHSGKPPSRVLTFVYPAFLAVTAASLLGPQLYPLQ